MTTAGRIAKPVMASLMAAFLEAGLSETAVCNQRAVVSETRTVLEARDEDGSHPRPISVHKLEMENEYLRVMVYPELGGRIASVFDKSAQREMFLRRPVLFPTSRYAAYGSQLGGIEVNFPCFHHGNSFLDKWNWLIRNESDGSATIFLAWTEPDSRNRVVHRLSLSPGEAVLRSSLRFANLNALPGGFAPWSNMFFGYSRSLQFVIPSPWVAPHGFNDSNLDLLPWPWPDCDENSVCFWRNIPDQYQSIFAVAVQENFHGVYYHDADAGMARIFDRTASPGIKMFCHPPSKNPKPSPTDYCEIWTGPAPVHEDARWWDAYDVREYSESFCPVHGIGGYRFANEYGAVNLTRGSNCVETGVCVTRPLPSAVVKVAGIDGAWLHSAIDLHPARPFRAVIRRPPGRDPLDITVADSSGRIVIRWSDHPDPGPRATLSFSGKPLWSATSMRVALKAEQYHPLWRGPTGGYGDYCARGIAAYEKLLAADPSNREARIGLARCLVFDSQLRRAGKPLSGTPEEMESLMRNRLEQAAAALKDLLDTDGRSAALYAEIMLRKGLDADAAVACRLAPDEPVARVCAAIAAAKLGDIETARNEARTAARFFPDSPPVIQLAAGLEIAAGNCRNALDILERLYARDPLDPVTLLLQKAALRRLGSDDLASKRAELTQALERSDPPLNLAAELRKLGLQALAAEAE